MPQRAFGFESSALDVNEILALSLKTPGWNNRNAPPQFATLASGCRLIVIPAWLWQPRSCVRRKPVCAPIRFPPRLRKVV